MKKSALTILVTVLLDGIGMGLILPILPALVRELAGTRDSVQHFGILMALYAAMQFLCSPILGALSDRFGRRPVLLVSLAGAAADYVLMFMASTLPLLYVGRIVAGITGANIAVATAYIADTTPEDQRPKAYGHMNACFGLGFVIGPALGFLGAMVSLRTPFLLAAALNALNLALAVACLPESHTGPTPGAAPPSLNPFKFLGFLKSFRNLLALLAIYFLIHFIGQIPGSLWVFYVQDKFLWTTTAVGISFVAFGLLHAGIQAFLTGPATKRLGEVRVLLAGMVADAVGFLLLAVIVEGWMVYLLVPILATGGIAMPALQTLLSKQVTEDHQGELQGILVSLMSMAAIVGPLAFTRMYAATAPYFLGTPFLLGAALYLLCIPFLVILSRQKRAAAAAKAEAEVAEASA
jgi:DHA1 family tetracycline resistance protein-like MFS transporter